MTTAAIGPAAVAIEEATSTALFDVPCVADKVVKVVLVVVMVGGALVVVVKVGSMVVVVIVSSLVVVVMVSWLVVVVMVGTLVVTKVVVTVVVVEASAMVKTSVMVNISSLPTRGDAIGAGEAIVVIVVVKFPQQAKRSRM